MENHLENNKEVVTPAKPQTKTPTPAKPQTKAPGKDESEDAAEPPTRELASKKDYQLGQALNLLKGLQIMQNKP